MRADKRRRVVPAYTEPKFSINPRNQRFLTGEKTNMAKGKALDAKSGTIFLIEEDSKTVEVKLITDTKHDLYDARVKDEPAESFVMNVAHYGIKEPVLAVKGPEEEGKQIVFIVAGRKRFKAWKAANKLLRERGAPTLTLPVKLEHGEIDEKSADEGLIGTMVLENAQREEDRPMNMARKAAAMLNRSGDEEKVAMAYGWPISTLHMHLELLKLHKDVQALVDAGDLSPSAAAMIAKLPVAEQWAVAEQSLSGPENHGGRKATVKKVQAKVRAHKKGKGAKETGETKAVGRKELKRIMRYLETKVTDGRLSDVRKGHMTGCIDLIKFQLSGYDPDESFKIPDDFDPKALDAEAKKKDKEKGAEA